MLWQTNETEQRYNLFLFSKNKRHGKHEPPKLRRTNTTNNAPNNQMANQSCTNYVLALWTWIRVRNNVPITNKYEYTIDSNNNEDVTTTTTPNTPKYKDWNYQHSEMKSKAITRVKNKKQSSPKSWPDSQKMAPTWTKTTTIKNYKHEITWTKMWHSMKHCNKMIDRK